MAVIVSTGSGDDDGITFDRAKGMQVVNSVLYVEDEAKATIAVFADGAWRSARVVKGLKD